MITGESLGIHRPTARSTGKILRGSPGPSKHISHSYKPMRLPVIQYNKLRIKSRDCASTDWEIESVASVSRRASLLICLAPSGWLMLPCSRLRCPLNPKSRGTPRKRCMQSLGGRGKGGRGGAGGRIRILGFGKSAPTKKHHSCSFLLPRRCGFSGESTRLSAVR